MIENLITAMTDMREEEVSRICNKALEEGVNPLDVLDAARKALEMVGKRFEEGTCFVPELILAGEIYKQISEKVKPLIEKNTGNSTKKLGKIVIGTVAGD